MIPRHPRPSGSRFAPPSPRPLFTFLCLVAVTLGASTPLARVVGGSGASLRAGEPAPVLEKIEYRRNGEVENAVGEVEINGDRVRLRLFSEQLASHYEIWVEIVDFLGATPLGSEENAATLATREARIEAHKIEREEARQRRIEKRKAEEAKKDRPSRARGTASPRRTSPTSGSDSEARRKDLPEDTAGFATLADELDSRIETARSRCSEFLNDIAPRLAVARSQKRTLRRIAGAIEDAQSELDEVASGLAGRKKALVRVDADVAAGAIRGKQLAEHLGSMGRRFDRLEDKLSKVERRIELEARSLTALPPESVEEPEVAEDPDRAKSRSRSGAAPSSAAHEIASRRSRLDPIASHNARVAEAASALAETSEPAPAIAPTEESPTRESISSEDRSEVSAVPAPAAKASTPESESESSPAPAGGGLPVWPLYPLGVLACYLLWQGQRGTKVDRGEPNFSGRVQK